MRLRDQLWEYKWSPREAHRRFSSVTGAPERWMSAEAVWSSGLLLAIAEMRGWERHDDALKR